MWPHKGAHMGAPLRAAGRCLTAAPHDPTVFIAIFQRGQEGLNNHLIILLTRFIHELFEI